MQIGGGIIAAALVVAFVWNLSAHQTQSTLDARHRAQDRAESAEQDIANACRSSKPGAVVECVAAEIEASREDQRAEYDLSAQDRMAEWAFWMMVASIVTTALTAVALWFIKGTLDASRRAVEEARNATEAAQIAVEVTRETAAHQLRAYVGPKGVNFHYSATTQRFAASVEIVNFGQTPAYEFRLRAGLNYVPTSLGAPPDIGPIGADGGDTLYPTMVSYASLSVAAPPERLEQINAKRYAMIFTVQVAYADHTGTERSDVIRWYFNPDMNGGPLIEERGGNLTSWPGHYE